MQEKSEKKVEYIELIYDLIFVYLIGRNNSLMDLLENGFVTAETFITYVITSLIILQIWYHSSLFINRYGENGPAEKIMLLINMFLLYIMVRSTVNDWGENYSAYMLSWSVILLNIAFQYFLKLRSAADDLARRHIKQNIAVLIIQAAIALSSIPIYNITGYALGAWAMAFGFAAAPFIVKMPVNFAHLTERVMLYVVFTFGEMIISVAGYFSAGWDGETMYFALMSFLTVAGLFFSYGLVYDKLLDRENCKDTIGYMLLHIVLILCLTNICNGLDFMREFNVDHVAKTAFTSASILSFYICLAITEHWSKRRITDRRGFVARMIVVFTAYVFLMSLTIEHAKIAVAVTPAFIFLQLRDLVRSEKNTVERGA